MRSRQAGLNSGQCSSCRCTCICVFVLVYMNPCICTYNCVLMFCCRSWYAAAKRSRPRVGPVQQLCCRLQQPSRNNNTMSSSGGGGEAAGGGGGDLKGGGGIGPCHCSLLLVGAEQNTKKGETIFNFSLISNLYFKLNIL